MPKDSTITPQNFKLLLEWLDPEEELAVRKYEKIRQRLIKILQFRGCSDAESLANTTFDRVVAKMPEISTNYVGDPTFYFFGVAKLVLLEWRRKQSKRPSLISPPPFYEPEVPDRHQECLSACLSEISEQNREMLIGYYDYEDSSAKAKHRIALAERMGVSLSALQIRAFRIRRVVGECVRNCLNN